MAGSSTKQAGAPRWSALQRWTLGVTSMAAFMAGMDALVVTTALPTIHADLGAATSAPGRATPTPCCGHSQAGPTPRPRSRKLA
jgi:hypothetical protein